ncbi:TP901 family phage tail tape measure protein [Microbacterium sp. BE35]|uniref:phage tail tape measure protein n=1 Tax=Microbacterium sp. BE35 TaxID=2817773 RepID=UPI002862AAA9|nr:phage tail tape measure protein [Microbacterium sp. BE35]MDR7189785.1 TP901 family phage tail tape measure protein [Microbacterium sp. BE35]
MASERVVKVTLTAQMQNYLAGMEKARKATSDTASEAQKLAETKKQFDQLGRTALAAGGLMAVGLGLAISKFADFDQAMSNVQAATHETAANMKLLSDAALEAGASTVYSATEAAGAIEELAKAGISTTDILGGALTGALDLAAAGGIEVADAAGIAATTMQQFQLEGNQAAHVADLLAAGAGKAMGDVGDMSQALKQSGLVANQFGISVEETVGSLAAFASAGLLGSDAGTSFRTMLLRLANPTGEVKDLMKELGIEAYDAGGQFIGMSGLAGELQDSLRGMTDEQKNATLATIFGQDAIRAATILYEEGAAGIEEWTDKVNDAGYAAETAETRLDNLKGDIEALQGAVDTAMISIGAAADGPLRSFVQGLTGLVDKFNDMPQPAKDAVFWVGAVATAGSVALGSYLLLVPKIAEFNAALDVLGPKAASAARGIGMVAKIGGGALAGLAVGVVALDALQTALSEIGPSAEETANQIKTATDATKLFDAAIQKQVGGSSNLKLAEAQVKSLGDALDNFAKGTGGQNNPLFGNTIFNLERLGGELAKLAESDLPSAQRQFRLLVESGDLTEKQQKTLLETMPALRKELTDQATAAGVAADSQSLLDLAMGESEETTQENTDALRALAGQAESTGDEVDGLADQIRNFGSATLSTRDANRQFEQALDDLQASIDENGNSLDVTTQAGRDNQAALDDLAKSSLDLAAATYEQTGSQEDANKVVADGRQKLIDMLAQFGITGDAAEAYADELGLIPENIDTYVKAHTQDALNAIQGVFNKYDGRVITIRTAVGTVGYNPATDSLVPGRASGGAIHGPGTGTSDTAGLYRLSDGEHVLSAADVAAMGGQHSVYAFRESLHGGGASVSSGTSLPSSLTLRVGEREFTAYVEDVSGGVANAALRQAATPFKGGRR